MAGHIFVSYARDDAEYVEKLAACLNDADIPVWVDHEILYGENFPPLLQSQIDTCAALIVVMSPAATESRWVHKEIHWAEYRKKLILPVLLEGDPLFAVGPVQYEDVRSGSLPSEKFVKRLKDLLPTPPPPAQDEGRSLTVIKAHQGQVLSVAYPATNGSLVASAGTDSAVRIWDAATGALRVELPGAAWPVVFSPDGSILATSGADHAVHLWNAANGNPLGTVAQHSAEILGIAISANGKVLATGSKDKTERLWDLSSGELLHTLGGKVDPGSPIVFAPSGEWLVAPNASRSHSVSLWDANTGKLKKTLSGHRAPVRDVTVSWDGRLVGTCGDDRTARVWDVETGKRLFVLNLHTRPVRAVAFSPTRHRIATGSSDYSINLWDAETGTHVRTLTGHTGGVYDLAYAPDGSTLASGGGDGTLRIWKG